MKKKLIACLGLLGLTMTSVLASPIVSHAEEATTTTPSETVNLAAEGRASTPVTEAEIEQYINANFTANSYFWLYKTLTKATDWKESVRGNVVSDFDSNGNVIYGDDHDLPVQINFKKGQVYVISGKDFTGTTSSDIGNSSEYTSNVFDSLYKPADGSDLYTFIYNNSSKASLCDENLYSDLAQGEYSDESKWDARISPAILDNFRAKLVSISNSWGFQLKYEPTHIFAPKNDFSVVLDSSKVSSHPEDYLYIKEATLMSADFVAPEIGGTVHLSVNVDSQPSVEEILSHVKAIDETDGEVPVTLVSSTYEPGVMEVGDYIIKVSAKDSASNTSTSDITVHRYDSTIPVITGKDSYDLNYNHDITLQKVLDALTITDNVDSNLKLEVVSDTFTGHEHELGNYQIVVRTKDLSNNYSVNKTIPLSVKNKGTAVITAPAEITVTISQPLTLDQLKERISVEDGYDGTITDYKITGFDDYEAKSGVVGTNTITISYTNSGNNTATATITIKKVDDKAPGIYFDSGYYVILPQGQEFTLEQFKAHVAKVLMVTPEEIESVEGEYDTNTAGKYTMKVKLASGTTETFNVAVGDVKLSVNQFHFKDLFTKFFWQSSYNNCLANMTKPGNWNWMNWTLVCIAGVIVLAIVGGFLFNKKKKQG